MRVGPILAADAFYTDRPDLYDSLADYGVLAVEMESAAIYTIAARYRARALTILTVSDHIKTRREDDSRGARADLRRDGPDRPGHRHRLSDSDVSVTPRQHIRPVGRLFCGTLDRRDHRRPASRRGDRTRAAMLDGAVVLATEDGLDGLSLGQLADRLSASASPGCSRTGAPRKTSSSPPSSGPASSGPSRSWLPPSERPRGVRRLWALHERRISFYAVRRLPGGCFFANIRVRVRRPPRRRPRPADRGASTEWLAAPRAARRRGRRGPASCRPKPIPGPAGVRDRVDRPQPPCCSPLHQVARAALRTTRAAPPSTACAALPPIPTSCRRPERA